MASSCYLKTQRLLAALPRCIPIIEDKTHIKRLLCVSDGVLIISGAYHCRKNITKKGYLQFLGPQERQWTKRYVVSAILYSRVSQLSYPTHR